MDIEMDPANDLFQLSDPEADEDEPVEEIYHLTLQHFYPARSVALLQRSMGLPLDPPWEPPPQELKKFEVSYSRHDELGAAGSLRNYIILGCRPTYPFTVISFVRQRTDNPYDVWHWVYPQGPYPTATGSIVHWDVDIAKELLHPRLPPTPSTLPQESAYNRVTDNMVLTLMCSAWDLRRDEFVQISMWTDPEGQDKRGYALSYGEVTGGIRTTAREGTTICLCGCGMSAKEDVHIKFTVPSAIVFWFPYQKKVIPEI
ncbi:hypothetical protein DRE_05136 [Drechslerella stenobrocha 248]|uniref:Uncharacterized protein n=1 Tax=Drechslerella stenobrocha 248 TaxID=1043628 RepID=W7HRI0_9PEZI|nr:hypothetical protein DRE_05136 [Drechslerella stenobrocha 248]